MKSSRRDFLKVAGISALGVGAAPVVNVLASTDPHAETKKPAAPAAETESPDSPYKKRAGALSATRWGMVIDMRQLNDKVAANVAAACHSIHNVPNIPNKNQEIKWVWADGFNHVFPTKEDPFLAEKFRSLPILTLCNHCDNPPCVRACPTKATFKRESDGVVLMDFHRCIGCRFCMAACPYGSRSFNFVDPRKHLDKIDPMFPTRMKGVVEKCNFCAERLAKGQMPACVEASSGAIAFGDLDDPNSTVRKLLNSNYAIRRKEGLGTGPSVYYIV